ncbi:hypothetical protein SAMN04488513_10198 [Pseudozobellia thermophila]|uniref:Uncharacterized protein n=1 Tax=Pseudozobellia thermophila TaxID=192903 RepID=A0A1M6AL56_9FLAO|nr:hypothetical protein SAMN04488513_10198 [Pseudozobellia thermophila]
MSFLDITARPISASQDPAFFHFREGWGAHIANLIIKLGICGRLQARKGYGERGSIAYWLRAGGEKAIGSTEPCPICPKALKFDRSDYGPDF